MAYICQSLGSSIAVVVAALEACRGWKANTELHFSWVLFTNKSRRLQPNARRRLSLPIGCRVLPSCTQTYRPLGERSGRRIASRADRDRMPSARPTGAPMASTPSLYELSLVRAPGHPRWPDTGPRSKPECLVLAIPSCRKMPSATASLPPKADLGTDFDCFTPNSGRQLGVACRGNFDPERTSHALKPDASLCWLSASGKAIQSRRPAAPLQ